MEVISKYNITRFRNQLTNFKTTWQNFSQMQTMPDNGYWLETGWWLFGQVLPIAINLICNILLRFFSLYLKAPPCMEAAFFVNGKDLPPLAYEPSTIQIKNLFVLYARKGRPACVGLSWFWGLHAEATTVLESTTLKLGEALGHKALCLDSALLKLLRKCIYLGFFWLFSSQQLNPLDYFVPAIF
jgi:hypothetical protein